MLSSTRVLVSVSWLAQLADGESEGLMEELNILKQELATMEKDIARGSGQFSMVCVA